jgi:hypothetical protein
MGSKKTTKSENTPWAPAQPYITDSLSGLKSANEKGQASLDANMGGINSEIARLTDKMANPPEYQTAARDQLTKTINGDYVNANPYTSDIADLIAQKTGAQYNSTFGSAGRAHGGMAALLSGQGVGDALQSFYSDQYNNERALQQQAIGMAPSFNQDEYTGLNNLLPAVGNAALLPGQVAGQYASGVTGATAPYVQNKTTEKSGGLGQILSTGLGLAAQVGGAFLPMGGASGMSGLLGGASSGLGAGTGLLAGAGPAGKIAYKGFLG